MPTIVFIAFTTSWCAHCRHLERDFTGEQSPQLLDVAQNQELAESYEVSGYPTVIALVNGQEFARTVGYNNKQDLSSWMDRVRERAR